MRCYAPTREHAERLAAEAASQGLEARATASAAEAVEGADARDRRHLVAGDRPGGRLAHAPACTSTRSGRTGSTNRELDARAVLAADLIAVDDVENAHGECGDVLPLIDGGPAHLGPPARPRRDPERRDPRPHERGPDHALRVAGPGPRGRRGRGGRLRARARRGAGEELPFG